MKKIDLPDNNWAAITDPEDVTERKRKPFVNLQRRLLGSGVGEVLVEANKLKDLTDDERVELMRPVIGNPDFEMVESLNEALVAAMVEEWSFDLPVTADGVLDLPGRARRAIIAYCEPLVGALLGQTTDEDVLDPDSPTPPGNG